MAIQIEQALNLKLNAYAAGKSIPVEWEYYSDGTEQEIEGIHFRQSLLPASTTTLGIENTGSNDHTGIYQIMICGKNGDPSGPLKSERDSVLSEFKRGQRLTYGGVTTIIQSIQANASLRDGAYARIPVSITYRAFVSN